MEFDLYILENEENNKEIIDNFIHNLAKISTGRANPGVLESVKVDYYGTLTPINQISAISIPEPRQILIKPYDASTTKSIVASINKSSLGLNAVDEGDKARITIPELTTDRRKELVKSFGKFTEQAKIGIRNVRHDINKKIKADEELSEDEQKAFLEQIQKSTDIFIKRIDDLSEEKRKDLLTI